MKKYFDKKFLVALLVGFSIGISTSYTSFYLILISEGSYTINFGSLLYYPLCLVAGYFLFKIYKRDKKSEREYEELSKLIQEEKENVWKVSHFKKMQNNFINN
jgi:hypothetical protein